MRCLPRVELTHLRGHLNVRFGGVRTTDRGGNPCSSAHACAAPEGRAHGADTCACAGVPACAAAGTCVCTVRSEEHTSELQSQSNLVCRLLLEKKKKKNKKKNDNNSTTNTEHN